MSSCLNWMTLWTFWIYTFSKWTDSNVQIRFRAKKSCNQSSTRFFSTTKPGSEVEICVYHALKNIFKSGAATTAWAGGRSQLLRIFWSWCKWCMEFLLTITIYPVILCPRCLLQVVKSYLLTSLNPHNRLVFCALHFCFSTTYLGID